MWLRSKIPGTLRATSCAISAELRLIELRSCWAILLDTIQNLPEHRLGRIAPVVSESVLVNVALKILGTYRVIDAPDSILKEPEKALNGLCVDISVYIQTGFMLDSSMAEISP
jgi:hypothetical protein